MAFVSGIPLSSRRSAPLSRSALTGVAVNTSPAPVATALRMGYGDYSYLTDETKGHVGQYYVDKFRIASDFGRGAPKTQADALIGRTMKGGVLVPKQGIPQEIDPMLLSEEKMVDPRIAESEGEVYSWDRSFKDKYGGKKQTDLDDKEVMDGAFSEFRSSLAEERGKTLKAMNFGAAARMERIRAGFEEKYLCCLDGALDVAYARLQKISNPVTLSPAGEPQTEIPGFPYMGSVGAMNFQQGPAGGITYLKALQDKEALYKNPSGADTPEISSSATPSME